MKSFLFSIAFATYLSAFSISGQVAENAIPVPSMEPQNPADRYRIGFQDTIEVQVFRHPDLNQRVSVNSNGTINLFRLPEPVVAVCKTERELAAAIASAYQKDYLRNPEVNVVAVEQRSRAFSIIGAVVKPGHYFIGRPIRLLELLAQAGGQSEKAGSRIIVARTGSTSDCKMVLTASATPDDEEDFAILYFKLKDVLEAKSNLLMKPGDIVSVLDSDVVYVYGNVNKQGQVEMKEPLTLTQAIASAEGLQPASKKDDVRILRQKPGTTEREELIFSLDDINSRKVSDPFLEPNDVIAVSEDRTKTILNSIGRSLTNGIPSLFYRVP